MEKVALPMMYLLPLVLPQFNEFAIIIPSAVGGCEPLMGLPLFFLSTLVQTVKMKTIQTMVLAA